MRLLSMMCVVLLAAANAGATAEVMQGSQADPAVQELPRPTNAALFFWRAWEIEPKELQATVDQEFNGRDLAWVPSADVSKALAEAQGFLLSVVRATELPACDFGLEYNLGRDMDLSHIEKLRNTARLLVSDTRRLQSEGKIDDAVRRVKALYSMSLLVRTDHLTASSATAQGFARMASDEVRRLCAAGVLSASQKDELKKSADRLSGDDPFMFADAIRREGQISYHFLTTRFTGATAGQTLMSDVAKGGEPEQVVNAVQKLDGNGMKEQAAMVRDYHHQVAKAWNQEDAAAAIRAAEEKVVSLGFGPVALLVCPGLSAAKENSAAQLALIREARALLDLTNPTTPAPHGPVPPK